MFEESLQEKERRFEEKPMSQEEISRLSKQLHLPLAYLQGKIDIEKPSSSKTNTQSKNS